VRFAFVTPTNRSFRQAQPAETPSHARTALATADGATNTGANPGSQPAVSVPDAGAAPVARTPTADPSDKGQAQDASDNTPPVGAPPQGPAVRLPLQGPFGGANGDGPEPLQGATKVDTRGDVPLGASPMDVDPATVEAPDAAKSKPGRPRSQPRAPASAHPSGMWFCPMPRCARREGASPTGWSCLQWLLSHLRWVHLSAGWAPTDPCLRANTLRVCLACHELSAVGARSSGQRCSSTVLTALAAGNSAPQAQTRSPLSGAPPRAWIFSDC